MQITVSEPSGAAPATLWETLEDLPAWPEWCPTFTSVQPDGPLEVGTTARVLQPGLRPAVWTVDEVSRGRSFRWSSRGPGFVIVADHHLQPTGPGSTVRLSLRVTGPMAWAVGLIAGRTMRRYLRQEARALADRPNPAA